MDPKLEHKRRSARGLTLIELLVVMLIIALTSSVIVLNLPPPAGEARTEAERFAVRLTAASEQAIMSGSVIALELEPFGYRFYRYDRGGWRDLAETPFSQGRFPADVAVAFELPEPARRNEERRADPRDDGAPAPNVFFLPTGETTALSVSFTTRREQATLSLDNAGALKGPHVGRP